MSANSGCCRAGFPRYLMCCLVLMLMGLPLLAQEDLFLFFPKVEDTASNQVGVAVANDSDEEALLLLYFLSYGGELFDVPNIANPTFLAVGPRQQESQPLAELFCPPNALSCVDDLEGFLLVISDNPAVVGFFLTFSPDVSRIDGAEALLLNDFTDRIVFPELFVGDNESTKLNLLLIDDQPVDVLFELIKDGAPLQSKTITVTPGSFNLGAFSAQVEEVFDPPVDPQAYIEVSSTSFLVGYQEFVRGNAQGGRNAIPVPISRDFPSSLFGAQAASTPQISTQLTLINTSDETISLEINASPTGAPQELADVSPPESRQRVVATRQIDLLPHGLIREDLKVFLNLQSDFEGWLRVDGDRTGVVGNVTFGDDAGDFLSSVQLQASPVRKIVFSHVADGQGFFTGLTLLNTGAEAVPVTLDVFEAAGTKTGSAAFNLAPFEHRPDLLTEFVQGLAPQVEGFISVKTEAEFFTFELFGFAPSGSVKALSAVPPQRGNGTFSGQINPVQLGALSKAGPHLGLQVTPQFWNRDDYPASRAKNVEIDLNQPFRPGELIVQYKSGEGLLAQESKRRQLGLKVLERAADQVVLLGTDKVQRFSLLGLQAMSAMELETDKAATLELIEQLNRDPNIVYAQPNYIYQPMGLTPNDPLFARQWHYLTLNLESVWEEQTGDPNLVIAVIDTGAKFGHPDLAGRLVGGQYDLISDAQSALDGTGIDPDAEDPGDDPLELASSYHGTHVAGTVGAATNNGVGVAGVNWSSKLMILRVLGAGGGTSFDISQAVRYAARLTNASGELPTVAARIQNMSLGGPASGPLEAQTIEAALNEGVIIVAAAGNEDSNQVSFPAALPGVLAIGALDQSGDKAPYSNYGTHLDFMAPGGNIAADVDGDGFADGVLSPLWNQSDDSATYAFYQGTSMATPHVAGVISLIISANPSLTPMQVENILKETAIDLGVPGRDDRFGYGLINPRAAVLRATNQGGLPPQAQVTPSILNFGVIKTELTAIVFNGGGGDLIVDEPTVQTDSGGDWLTAQLQENRQITATVQRAGLPDGQYTGRVHLTSTGGTATIEVRMKVGVDSSDNICNGNEDCIFILALDPRTFETVGFASAGFGGLDGDILTPEDRYTYASETLPAGSYIIIGGTDLDDDGFICDDGEFCGAFPVSNQSTQVEIVSGQNVEGISFTVEKEPEVTISSIPNKISGETGVKVVRNKLRTKLLNETLKSRIREARGEQP